jgi:hypothetical protein
MVYDYLVTLKNERRNVIDGVSMLLTGLSALFFLSQVSWPVKSSYIFLISFLVLAAGLAFNWYNRTRKNKQVFFKWLLFLAGITWFAMPFLYWAGIPMLLLGLIEKQAKFPLEIGFKDDRIVFNTLIKKKYGWEDFNNILIKDNVLTLDFKSNKLFQKETIDEEGDAEEDEFNEYCRLQLGKTSPGVPR